MSNYFGIHDIRIKFIKISGIGLTGYLPQFPGCRNGLNIGLDICIITI